MANEVVLVGKAELDSIFQSLKKMREGFEQGNQELGKLGKNTQDTLDKTRKKTEDGIKQTGGALRKLAGQLTSDFKALFSLNALSGALKLSSQFSGSITESIELSDTIRRVGRSFDIARDQFGKFQSEITRGLGDIGAGSDAAARALEGLTGMGVKGGESVKSLATGAVTLAGMSGEKGNEKGVAGLLGKAMQATGGDVNDLGRQKAMIGEVTAAVQATGKSASEILSTMDQMFSGMDKGLRGKVTPEAMAQMATMAATIGPGATKAIQEYLSKGKIERMPMEMQGFNIFGKGGNIDFKALKGFVDSTKGRVGGDARKSLQTAGFSEEAAEGLVRLAEQSDRVKDNLKALDGATRDNVEAYERSLGLADSFKGTLNTLKSRLDDLAEGAGQTATDFMTSQIGSTGGSAVVAGGGAVLAALLASGGLKGIGGFLFGEAQKKATEEVTGEKVQNVFVTNAAEIAAEGAAAHGGGMLGGLGKAGLVGAAGAVGFAAGKYLVNPVLDKFTQGKSDDGQYEGNMVERMMYKLDKGLGYKLSGTRDQHMKVVIQTTEPHLKATTQPKRGVPF
jgi:hypothetical protein